jgi:uncharacterized protein YebE (UPF0316 family)
MDIFSFAPGFDWYGWVILPIIIFFARVCDVTLGTIRIILVARGKRNIAPLLGFCEVLIWIVVIGQLVQHLQSITSFIGYAAGFATGNYIGMLIEDRLAIGSVIVRTIVPQMGEELARQLHEAGFGVTSLDGHGANGPVKIIYTVVQRKNLSQVTQIIRGITPKAFFSIEDVRSTEEGIFPSQRSGVEDILFRRKAK